MIELGVRTGNLRNLKNTAIGGDLNASRSLAFTLKKEGNGFNHSL
jgi:hypothetical protein